jgi:hypothetical protein
MHNHGLACYIGQWLFGQAGGGKARRYKDNGAHYSPVEYAKQAYYSYGHRNNYARKSCR